MTHTTPEHLVRPDWQGAQVVLTCLTDGCGWAGRVGYPHLTGLDMDSETQRTIYRAAVQAAAVHGWPDLDHLPADGIIARSCDCQPDPTATAGFWARLKGAVL